MTSPGLFRCVVRQLPVALWMLCLLNWVWSQSGQWWVELSGITKTGIDTLKAHQGIYSTEGHLLLVNRYFDGLYAGMPKLPGPPVVITRRGFNCGFDLPFPFGDGSRRWTVMPYETERQAWHHPWAAAWMGFAVSWEPDNGTPFMHRWLVVPWWFLVAVTSIIPLKRAWVFLRQRRQPRPGFCPKCGYDLRATPTRCPECGMEIRPTEPPDA